MQLFLPLPGLWSKNSFTISSPYLPRDSKLVFKTGNEMDQTGNVIISSTSRPLIKKNFFYDIFSILPKKLKIWFELSKQEMELFLLFPDLRSKNFCKRMFLNFIKQYRFWKQEMELSKQEIKLFFPISGPLIKNIFYDIFSIFTKDFNIDFWNRRCNFQNWKWNYFSAFQASEPKASDTKSFSFSPNSSKLIFQQKMELLKQEMELFLPLTSLWSKNFSKLTKEFKINIQNS